MPNPPIPPQALVNVQNAVKRRRRSGESSDSRNSSKKKLRLIDRRR